ncbi:unannotated protein [freshwater metagenome]|uniref:Unannotated protein n=1 Tax=freshwater metagenome TaxID=449393 RepID=A0A6J7I721_9ZZZZ
MHHGEGLAIVSTNTDIDPRTCIFLDHDASNFESADLTADLAMLDHDLESGLVEHHCGIAGDRRRFDRYTRSSGHRRSDDPTAHGPDLRRIGEQRRAAGHDAGIDLGIHEQVQPGRRLT